MSTRWKWTLAGLAGILLLLGLSSVCHTIHWDGSKDLEITFLVWDAEAEAPVKDAVIEIRAEKGFCKEPEERFTLSTDAEGAARRRCEQCMTCGTYTQAEYLFGLYRACTRDTFSMHLPSWLFRASAEGYAATEWTDLVEAEYSRQVQRGQEVASLTIRVPLRKKTD
jgi:hypothetical protein